MPRCADKRDLYCATMRSIVSHGALLPWVQNRVVQAQYFNPRDPRQRDKYLEKAIFLPDINNERPEKRKKEYADRLARLEKFVMVDFADDDVLVPARSAWFAFYGRTDRDKDTVVPLRNSTAYAEDWVGLRTLDARGALAFETFKGNHMQITVSELLALLDKHGV